MKTVMLIIVMCLSTMAIAQEPAHHPVNQIGEKDPHPVISEDSRWAGSMVIIVLGLFLAAAVIGPIVRANMPPAAPDVPLHDMHADADDAHGHAHDQGHGHGH